MLVTKAHIQHLYDTSDIDIYYDNDIKRYVLSIVMPNGTVFIDVAETQQTCIDRTKIKIRELEEYLERDKRKHGYAVGNEYE